MGKTVIEKILSAHTGRDVSAGDIIWMDIDVRTARDFGGANVVNNFRSHFPGEKVADPEKTLFTFDCVVPANTIAYANNQHICRMFAREQGIKVYDVDSGIGSHVLIEKGYALPGTTVVGTDSHLNILGAVGCFGQGMGDTDIAFAFRTGKTWFEVPPTIKIDIKGRFDFPTTAKDLILYLLKNMGASGALGMAVELYGEAVDGLSLAERITVASMATEMGAISIFISPNEEILNYCKQRSGKQSLEVVVADADAQYIKQLEFDVQGLKPQVALPPSPTKVCDVSDLIDTRIDSVFIGSCTNGRFEDFQCVAEIVKGKKVAPWVMAKIVPATREVYGRMLEEGLLEIFYHSGFIVSNPGCGGCASGQIGMTGKGEVQVSTSNRNFEGKQGAGLTYLVSPATAAASSIAGRIVSV